ncbi:colanic acid exporter [Adhaeretor mobilis]|uniref:Colanic acid exporter n=2 Tax=Adhaeretor mobilis TaxID=1930276 RepID=A0A517MQ03_9BACT|nr:colanic acid exporter [Adhaeretor mobilis]
MTLEDYGTYGQVLLTGNFAGRLFSFGLATVIFVFYAQNRGKEASVFQSNLLGSIVIGLIGSLLVFLFSSEIGLFLGNDKLGPLLKVYAIVVPFGIVKTTLDSTLIYFSKIKTSAVLLVIGNLVSFALMLSCLFFYYSLYNFIASVVVGSIFNSLLLAAFVPRDLLRWKGMDLKLIRRQIWIGFPLGISLMLGLVFKLTDSAIVSKLLGVEQYAVFRNGAIELPFIAAIYSSVTKIVLPDISKLFANGQMLEIVKLKRRIASYNAIFIYPLASFLVVFAEPIVSFYFSKKYVESAPILAIYTLILFFRVVNYGDIFTAASKNFQQVLIFLTAIAINVPLTFILVKSMGPPGAAVATVAGYALLLLLLLNYSTKILDVSIHAYFDFVLLGKIIGACVLGIISSFLIYHSIGGGAGFCAALVMYSTILACCYYWGDIFPVELLEAIMLKKKLGAGLSVE